MQLPTGTVTFLFTDIEGSTRLLQRLGDGYRAVQDDHARIMCRAIDEGRGVAIRTKGDSFLRGVRRSAVIITGHLRTLSLVANQFGQARAGRAPGRGRGGLAGQVRLPGPRRVRPFEDPGRAAAHKLSEEAFRRGWTEGEAMSLEEALVYAAEEA